MKSRNQSQSLVVNDRRLASHHCFRAEGGAAGGHWIDAERVGDGILVTSRDPADSPGFCQVPGEALAEAGKGGKTPAACACRRGGLGRRRRGLFAVGVLAWAWIPGGCAGRQSALDPAGDGAQRIYELTLWMAAGGLVTWLAVVGLAIYTIYLKRERIPKPRAARFIIGGGAIVPTVVLCALLVYGLAAMPPLLEPAPPGSLRIAVHGEQWWWRVRYQPDDGAEVELANEIRLPAGEPVEFALTSADVVHSFWIAPLGPKIDMIPGRTTRLVLHPTRPGRFRGVCAEFCGLSHALMTFDVVVVEKDAFARWLAAQGETAADPPPGEATRGAEVFLATGCGACHTVRGTPADGVIGPDLTHVGGRLSVGAGILPNDPSGFVRWLSATEVLKPGVRMPHFGMLPPDEQQALALYLDSLE